MQAGNSQFILATEYQRNQIYLKSNKSIIMKRRVRKIANFFAFNLLFFALYLNFIHKDKTAVPGINQTTSQETTAAFSGTVLVDNQQQSEQKNEASVVTQPAAEKTQSNSAALKLSIN